MTDENNPIPGEEGWFVESPRTGISVPADILAGPFFSRSAYYESTGCPMLIKSEAIVVLGGGIPWPVYQVRKHASGRLSWVPRKYLHRNPPATDTEWEEFKRKHISPLTKLKEHEQL